MDSELEIISNFSWGSLAHFLGINSVTKKCHLNLLKIRAKSKYKKIAIEILSVMSKYSLSDEGKHITRQNMLRKLEFLSDSILNPKSSDLPNLSMEAPRGKDFNSRNFAYGKDGITKGFSRHPFRRVTRKKYLAYLSLAAISYLLRAYSQLFKYKKDDRNYNYAKLSQNDLYQAYQLFWRLYENLKASHHSTRSLNLFFNKVIDGGNINQHPWESCYFAWAGQLIVDMQRGNISTQIGYYEASDHHYKRVMKRLDTIFPEHGWFHNALYINKDIRHEDKMRWFITPSILKSMFEYSKYLFDEGKILDSLSIQTTILLIIVSTRPRKGKNIRKIKSNLEDVITYLRAERSLAVWNKVIIASAFGDPRNRVFFKENGIEVKDFINLIPTKYASLAVDIFARIGFILFTIGKIPSTHDSETPSFDNQQLLEWKDWLTDYFRSDLILKADKPSPMGIYCQTLLIGDTKPALRDGLLFTGHSERQFAFRLRENIKYLSGRENPDYVGLIDAVTQNIGNMVTIPRKNQKLLMRAGYLERRSKSSSTLNLGIKNPELHVKSHNKIVVLRRWQSYNPKLPRPDNKYMPGGGYLLIWEGKGIVIDPGYNFIQNLYDEGFSLDDIHAIFLSHSHPDHDDDLWTMLTLLNEWNDYYSKVGRADKQKKIDLFLNESGYRKFSTWVHSRKIVLGRIVPLPLVVWDKNSNKTSIKIENNCEVGPRRGENVIIDLTGKAGYSLKVEVVPAWHDDVINSIGAAGFKFHLIDSKTKKEMGILGYTGDTQAYGFDLSKRVKCEGNIAEQYSDCDVLIAHLGDLRLREIETLLNVQQAHFDELVPLEKMIQDLFCKLNRRNKYQVDRTKLTINNVSRFLHLLQALDLISEPAMNTSLNLISGYNKELEYSIGSLIQLFLRDEWPKRTRFKEKDLKIELRDFVTSRLGIENINERRFDSWINKRFSELGDIEAIGNLGAEEIIYILISVICIISKSHWQYPNHLGLFGLMQLMKYQAINNAPASSKEKVLIVGELPEELASYRHRIARWLNKWAREQEVDYPDSWIKNIFAYTGDIGLHVSLENSLKGFIEPKIRCSFCNHNNETVKQDKDYHVPSKVNEVMLKRCQSGMIYLCKCHDHYPSNSNAFIHFLSNPEMRVL